MIDLNIPDRVDGVIVGGGHNSLVAAAYLAKAGLSVVVVEAANQLGGGTTTAEVTLPLFKHNLHAFFVRWTADYTIWNDLDLDRYGVRSIYPEVQNAVPFEGGERALVTYSDVGKSIDTIAELNATDAEHYRRLHDEYLDMTTLVDLPLRLSPPLTDDELHDRLSGSVLGRRYLELQSESALDVVRNAFEFEPLRALILFNVAVRGYVPNLDVVGTGSVVALALTNSHQGRIIEGGTAEAARALAAAMYAHGGVAIAGSAVASIDVSNGRATGVTLEDGRKIEATRFVMSSVPAPMTLLELVGGEHLDEGLREDLGAYRWLEEALFGVHWALEDRPVFTCEQHNPDVPRSLNLALGYESSDDLVAHMDAINAGTDGGRGELHASIPTMHDPTQAPTGFHTTFGWYFVPGPPMRGKWEGTAFADVVDRMTAAYEKYAPGFGDKVLATYPHSPDDTEARVRSMRHGDRHHGSYHPGNWGINRPTPLMPGHRTPIDGLYLCGASQHPGGSFTGQPGYVAAGTVLDDLGIESWWERPDVAAALSALD